MVRNLLFVGISVLLLLFGCVKRDLVWVGGNPDDFDRDSYECERDAAMLPVQPYSSVAKSKRLSEMLEQKHDERMRKNMYKKCRQAKGWRLTEKD